MQQPQLVLGLMSGTSVDAVDACLCRFSLDVNQQFHYEIVTTSTTPMPEALKVRLLACMQNKPVLLSELCRLNMDVGLLFAETAIHAIEQANISPEQVLCIGSHGQTLFHLPPEGEALGGTLQIGEPGVIAERTGICTIGDFRPRDMAAGGHGAPLVSFADKLLFTQAEEGCCVQNIGGIGNVTVLPSGKNAKDTPVFAFDTGPGNMLIDGAMMQLFNRPYDEDGTIAAAGHIYPEMLSDLMAHPYLTQPPPKTTGRELFGQAMLSDVLVRYSALDAQDIIATLTRFTAQTIVDAYQRFVFPRVSVGRVIVGGGGTKNPTLMRFLQELLDEQQAGILLQTHEDYAIPNQYKEAMAFALLAWAAYYNVPNSLPSCTGARHAVVMGKRVS